MSSGTGIASIITASCRLACIYGGSALLDYKQLRHNGAHPENLWWFYHYLPFVYEKDRLIADNESEYLFGLRDLRWAAVASFTRVPNPGRRGRGRRRVFHRHEGPALGEGRAQYELWCLRGRGASRPIHQPGAGHRGLAGIWIRDLINWRYTRGAQRVRLRFVVRSDAGIAEVNVMDADRGPIRRFLGHGAKELSREFELVHDQQHYLTLEVMDTAGKKAISHEIMVYCYKAGLFRCGDNLNILGPTAMCWHPGPKPVLQRRQRFSQWFRLLPARVGHRRRHAGRAHARGQIVGHDQYQRGGRMVSRASRLGAMMGRLMDVGVNSYNMQIATMRMTKLSETYRHQEAAHARLGVDRPRRGRPGVLRPHAYALRADGARGHVCHVGLPAGPRGPKGLPGRDPLARGRNPLQEGLHPPGRGADSSARGPLPDRPDQEHRHDLHRHRRGRLDPRRHGSRREEAGQSAGPHPAGRLRRLDDHAGGLSRPIGPGRHGLRLPGLQPSCSTD